MVANGAVQSKLVYLITLWGDAQQYLLKALQLTAARTMCGFQSWMWSKSRLLRRVGWMSVRQMIEFHTVLQAHKTLNSGLPRPHRAQNIPTEQEVLQMGTLDSVRTSTPQTPSSTGQWLATIVCQRRSKGEV